MSKLLQNCLKATPLLLATVLLTNGFVNVKTAFANEVDGNVDSVLEGINNYESDTSNDQVTSVSQLRDVSPREGKDLIFGTMNEDINKRNIVEK